MELLRQRPRTTSEASAEDSGERWTTNVLRLIGIKAPTHDPRSSKQSSTFSVVRLLPLYSRFDGSSARTDTDQETVFTTSSSPELSEVDQGRVSTSTAPSTLALSGLSSQCPASPFASPTTTISSSANTVASTISALGSYQVEKGVFVSPTSKMSEEDLAVWKDIRKRLDDTLKNLFRPEPGLDPSVSLEFMVAGPSKSKLRPSIIIVCCNEPNRRRLKKMLKTQKWIAAYGYFCLVVVNPLEELSGPESHFACRPYEVWTDRDPATLSGLSAYTKKDDDGPAIRLTIGGTILVDDELYALTARHPIMAFPGPSMHKSGSIDSRMDWSLSQTSDPWDVDDDSEPTSPFVFFDSAESSDESDDELEFSDSNLAIQEIPRKIGNELATWRKEASQTSLGTYSREASTSSLEVPHAAHQEIQGGTKVGTIIMDIQDCPNSPRDRLDWSLIRLDQELEEIPSNSFQVPGDQEVHYITDVSSMEQGFTSTVSEVWIKAGRSGLIRGRITQGLTSLHWNGAIFDAERIDLDHPLIPGDSGSWVIENGRLRGHIVAQRTTMLFAYMIPIEAIFEDIKFWRNAEHVGIATSPRPLSVSPRNSLASESLTAVNQVAALLEAEPRFAKDIEIKYDQHQGLDVEDVVRDTKSEENAGCSHPIEPKCHHVHQLSCDRNSSGAPTGIDGVVIFEDRESLDFLLPAAASPNAFKSYEKGSERTPSQGWLDWGRVGKMSRRQGIALPEARQRMDDDLTHLEGDAGLRWSKPDWKPFVMSWPFLLFLIVMANVFAFAFQLLLVFGFNRASKNSNTIEIIPSSLITNVTLLSSPLLMSVVYGSLWRMTDAEVARLEPFYQLSSSKTGVRGADSLTLDYASRNIFSRWYLSLRRRHWTVFICSTVTILTSIIAPVLSAAEISIPPSSPVGDEPGNSTFFEIQKWCALSLCILYLLTSALAVTLLVKITKTRSGLQADPRGIAGLAIATARFQGLRHFKDCDVATQEDIQRTIGHRLFRFVDSSLYEEDPYDCELYPLQKLPKAMISNPDEGLHPTILKPKGIFALISGVLLSSTLSGIFTMLPSGRFVAYSVPWFQTLILVLFNICWERLDVAIRLVQPYYLLHRRHAPPRTLLVDYTARPSLCVIFQAAKQRHFVVALVALCRVLGGYLIVLTYFTSCWANMSSAVADRQPLAEAWLAVKDSVDGVVPILLSTIFAIAASFIFVAMLVFSRRLKPFLPRQPTTIASVLAFIHQSKMMYYFDGTEMLSRKGLGRSLDKLGGTYGFGWFEGRDGRSHLGIDKEEIIAGYKHGFDYSRSNIPWMESFEEWL